MAQIKNSKHNSEYSGNLECKDAYLSNSLSERFVTQVYRKTVKHLKTNQISFNFC